jgi:hypothetical protein
MLGEACMLLQRRCARDTERRGTTEEGSRNPAAWAAAQTVIANGALNRGSQPEHCTRNADADSNGRGI